VSIQSAFPTILDAPESRFPLQLGIQIPKIRDLFHAATRSQWNPATDINWDALDPQAFSAEQRDGARMYWSRRAWAEYGAISESPALQIRFCQEKQAPDMRLFFTIRSQEESRHAEVCYRMAERLGGYIEQPQVQYQGSVATHGVRRLALDPEVPLEGVIAALVCAAEEIAFDVFRHLVEIASNPVARQVCRMIMRDEVRHCAFGWQFMAARWPQLDATARERVRDSVITMIEKVELNGYHSSWLAPDNPASRAEMISDRLTWEAGLGATVEELEKPVFVASIARIRHHMKKDWDMDLPLFTHPKIDGRF
jgi:P-aminobenzoate N-oxygenase AurF